MNDEVIKSEERLPEYRFDRAPEIFPEIIGKERENSGEKVREWIGEWGGYGQREPSKRKMNESKKRISTAF